MKKSIGFFLTIASAVIALVSIFLYGNVFAQADNTRTCLIVSVIVAAIAIGMSSQSCGRDLRCSSHRRGLLFHRSDGNPDRLLLFRSL